MKVKKEALIELAKEVLQSVREPSQKSRSSGAPLTANSSSVSASPMSEKAFIIALRGDLGAGKTTFTQALARELGITETIQSPTYVLMKSYPISFGRFTKFVHIDAYRLEKPEEFGALKPEVFLNDREVLMVIEWPERVEGQLPAPDIVLNFSHTDSEEERHIEILK
jgi:tRNA threonylcarbamoyladenosine biosynthesis protein TsaE